MAGAGFTLLNANSMKGSSFGATSRKRLGQAAVFTQLFNRLGPRLAPPIVDTFEPLVFWSIQNVRNNHGSDAPGGGFLASACTNGQSVLP